MMCSESQDELLVISKLEEAITNINEVVPFIEKMNGKLPQRIINLLDELNRLSVMY